MKFLKIAIPALIVASILLISQGILRGNLLAQSEAVTSGQSEAAAGISGQQTGEDSLQEADSSGNSSTGKVISIISPGQPAFNDPYFDQQWSLAKIGLASLDPVKVMESAPVLVAVLDTGIDKNHEDLTGKVVSEVNFSDSPTVSDLNGHGTFVAGIIGSDTDNGIGIAAVDPESRLLDVKVADDRGRCDSSSLARGIIWAADHGASVINVSLELPESSPELENAVNYAWDKGAVIVAAVSNETVAPVYPAYYKNVISVVSTNYDDKIGPLSGYGDWVDVAAPGFSIYSTLPDNRYGYKTGTSFATANVSGLAALLFGIARDNGNNGKINDEVRAAIEKGARTISPDGIGLIDAVSSAALISR